MRFKTHVQPKLRKLILPAMLFGNGEFSSKLDVFSVLPELSIPTHVYTIFVYNEILLKKKDLIENITHEFRCVYQFELLDILGKLGLGYLTDETEIVELLEQFGLKYIQQFLFYAKSSTNYENTKL